MITKVLKWTAIVAAGLTAILLIAAAVWAYVTSSRVEARLEELRAAGDPICISDLAPEPVPADQNAAVPMRRIRDNAKALLTEVGDYLQSDNYHAGTPTDDEIAMIETAFEAYPDLIPAIQQALALKGYQRDIDYSLPPTQFLQNNIHQYGDERTVARILALHASVLRSHGQWDEAATVSIQLFQLANLCSENARMLTDYLVSLALRTMAVQEGYLALRSKAVSAEIRGQLKTELASADPLPGYLVALKSERAFGIDSFESFPVQVLWGGAKLNYLDVLAEEIRLAPLPLADYHASPERAAAAASAGTVVCLLLPSLQSAREATERIRANTRALRLADALLSRPDPDAPPPADLTELGLPPDATIDPFSGKPLIVKNTPGGWKVYSVGTNLIDDGGKLDDDADFGVGPKM